LQILRIANIASPAENLSLSTCLLNHICWKKQV